MQRNLCERDIAAYLIKKTTALGGIARKVAWEGRANAPDYLIMCNGTIAFVETKAPGRKARPNQMREFEAMRVHGGATVHVVSTFAEVDALFTELFT